MIKPIESNDTNSFLIKSFETVLSTASAPNFGVKIIFERNLDGRHGILISYHLMCGMLVLVASINFLIDPKDSNRAAILIALLLILATIFNATKVFNLTHN